MLSESWRVERTGNRIEANVPWRVPSSKGIVLMEEVRWRKLKALGPEILVAADPPVRHSVA